MSNRTEFEQRLDHVEEAKLAIVDRQLRLKGLWIENGEGCPHLVKVRDWVNLCDAMKNTPCFYETYHEPGTGCEIFRQILEEWRIADEICPECGLVRAGDERVRNGMKCSSCAGY